MKTLICCVCGGEAPSRKQWWKRDSGYGACGECVFRVAASGKEEDVRSLYGDPGTHYILVRNAHKRAMRMAALELTQWHQSYHPECRGGCPTMEAINALEYCLTIPISQEKAHAD